jgi:enoyl-CoA hydratase/carnithine racemase
MGLTADVGTLQRLPKVIGSQSLVSDLCLTARKLPAEEALRCGLVSAVYDTREELMTGKCGLKSELFKSKLILIRNNFSNLDHVQDPPVEREKNCEGLTHG